MKITLPIFASITIFSASDLAKPDPTKTMLAFYPIFFGNSFAAEIIDGNP